MKKLFTDLTVQNGILESQESSLTPNGFLRENINWIAEPTGGLRVRGKWSRGSVTNVPSTRRNMGIGMFQRFTAPAIVQTTAEVVAATSTSPATITYSWASKTGAGNALVLVVVGAGSSLGTQTFTPPAGYTTISTIAPGSRAPIWVAVAENAASRSGDESFTFTDNTSRALRAYAFEVTNVAAVNVVESAVASDTATTTSTGPSITNTQSSALVFAIGAVEAVASDPAIQSASAGWTQQKRSSATSSLPGYASYTKVLSASAAQTLTFTTSASVDHTNTMLVLRGWYSPGVVRQATPPMTVQGTSVTLIPAWARPTLPGSTVLLIVEATSSPTSTISTTATGYTSTVGTTFTNANLTTYLNMFHQIGAASQVGQQSFPATASSNATFYCWMVELVGVASFDTAAFDTKTSNTPVAPSITTTQAWELLVYAAVFRTGFTTTQSPSSGFVEYADVTNGIAGFGFGFGYMTTAGVKTASITPASSGVANTAIGVLAGFKVARTALVDQVKLYLAAQDDTTSYSIWSLPQDDLANGTWTQIDTVPVPSTDLPVSFVIGFGSAFYSGAGFSAIRRFDGNIAEPIEGSPEGARCLAVHKQRLWAGSTKAFPTLAKFSQVDDPLTWSGRGSKSFPVGTEDGEPLEDITPFGDVLVIGKQTSAWAVLGDTSDTFTLVKLNAGGAAPGRSVLATPYGCVLAGREQVWMFDGSTVIPIGRGIERTYGLTGQFMSLSYIDGSIYIADYGTQRTFVFDFVGGTWRKERVGITEAESPAVLYNYGDVQLMGPSAGVVGSLLNYRTFPSPARGKDYDSLPEQFLAETGDLWLGGPTNPLTLRNLWMQVRQRGGDQLEQPLNVDVTYDMGDPEETWPVKAEVLPKVRRERVDLGSVRGMASAKFAFSHDALDGEEVTYDIESLAIEWDREEPQN